MKRVWGVFFLSALFAAFATLATTQQSDKQAAPATAPRESGQIFTKPVLVKGSPSNLSAFDVSWNDHSTQRYYLADRTNNAIDVVDSATDTFLGFIGRGHYTGSRPCWPTQRAAPLRWAKWSRHGQPRPRMGWRR
jgi:hypothetical protein